MGVVFSPEQVAAGQIPAPGAHEQAADFLMNEIFFGPIARRRELHLPDPTDHLGGIWSGLIYGSTALGRATLRSDVDILLDYSPQNAREVIGAARAVIQSAQRQYLVPVEALFVSSGSLKDPLRTSVDPLFLEHLIEVQKNPRWSSGWPVPSGLVHDARGVKQPLSEERKRNIAIAYCSGKQRQFARGLGNWNGTVDPKLYQRALELPSALGRKVLAAIDSDTDVTQAIQADGTWTARTLESALVEMHERYDGRDDLLASGLEHFQKLRRLGADYDELLIGTLQGTQSIEDYGAWYEAHYEDSISLGHALCHFWTYAILLRRYQDFEDLSAKIVATDVDIDDDLFTDASDEFVY